MYKRNVLDKIEHKLMSSNYIRKFNKVNQGFSNA